MVSTVQLQYTSFVYIHTSKYIYCSEETWDRQPVGFFALKSMGPRGAW